MVVKERKKKAWIIDNVKMPTETEILCSIDGETFHSYTKNVWVGKSSNTSHHQQ